MTPIHRETLPGLGDLELRKLDPNKDLDTVYGWVQEPRADVRAGRRPDRRVPTRVRDGDLGVHLFMAPARTRIPGFTSAVFESLRRFVFAEPSRQRIVIEPDARNEGALRRWQRLGFEFGDQVELPHKSAQLAFLSRLPHAA
jgi:hypothetical protein